MNNNHCRFLFVLFKARIIGIASSSASCKKGGIYSYKVEVTFAIDTFRYLYKPVNSCVSNTADSPSFSVFFNPAFVSFGIFIIADTNKKDFTAILFPV